MPQRRGRSLRLQLVTVLGIVVITVWAGVLVSVRELDSLRGDVRLASQRSRDVAGVTEHVLRLIVDLETGERGFALTGDETFLAPHAAARLELPGELARLRRLLVDAPVAQALVDGIAAAVERWHAEVGDVVIGHVRASAGDPARLADAHALVASGKGKAVLDAIRADVAALRLAEAALGERALAGIDARRARVARGLLITAALASMVALGFGLVIAARLQAGINRLVTAADRIATRQFAAVAPETGDLGHLADAMGTASGMLADAEREDRVLLEAGQVCGRGLPLDQLLVELVPVLARVISFDVATLNTRVEGQQNVFERVAAYPGGKVAVGDATRQPIDPTSPTGPAVLEGRVVIDNQVAVGEGLAAQRARAMGLRSVAVVPLVVEGEVVGLLSLASTAEGAFSQDHVPFLTTLGTQLAGSLWATELYRRLASRNVELERASRAKSDFLAMMSHELRTPLNAVIGFAEVLTDPRLGALSDRQKRYVDNIHASGRHLLGVINDLLDFSRTEAGKLEISRRVVAPTEVVTAVVDALDALATRKRQDVIVDVADGVPDVIGDPLRIRQALTNLLGNAIKFTPEQGRITVSAHPVDGGRRVRFAVTDDGPGVPEADRARLFVPFSQLEHQRTGGTGLGLALTKQLIQLMDGSVGLEPVEPHGSRFWFELPAAAQRPSALHGSSEVAVIVDDDPYAIELLDLTLREAGYATVSALDGDEALRLVRTIKPALVTLDLLLPTIDGWEVLRRLRADPETASVPVLVVSVSSDHVRSRSLGVVDHLIKPLSRDVLLAAVQKLRGQRERGEPS